MSDSSGHPPTGAPSPSTSAIHSPLHESAHTAQPPFVAGPSSLVYTTAQGSAGLVQTSALVNINVPQQQQPQSTIQPEAFKNVLDVLSVLQEEIVGLKERLVEERDKRVEVEKKLDQANELIRNLQDQHTQQINALNRQWQDKFNSSEQSFVNRLNRQNGEVNRLNNTITNLQNRIVALEAAPVPVHVPHPPIAVAPLTPYKRWRQELMGVLGITKCNQKARKKICCNQCGYDYKGRYVTLEAHSLHLKHKHNITPSMDVDAVNDGRQWLPVRMP